MNAEIFRGTIIFINHEKQYCTIGYLIKGKKKTINGKIAKSTQPKVTERNVVKPGHHFLIGDEVKFLITRIAGSGKTVADSVQYLYNNALNNLIQKAKTENRFAGYLKLVHDNFFVKETGSYLLFPLRLSKWEKRPDISKINEPLFFKLENLHNPERLTAALFTPVYIPAFLKARQFLLNKTPVDALIYNITSFAIYVNIIGDQIQAKIRLPEKGNNNMYYYKAGNSIKVIITFLSGTKIVVEKV